MRIAFRASRSIGALLIAAAAGICHAQSPAFVEHPVTTYRPVQRRVIVPVREYHTQQRWQHWWNPFRTPQLVTRYIPQTRWEERLETSYVPVTQRRYFAEAMATKTTTTLRVPQPAAAANVRAALVPTPVERQVEPQPLVPVAMPPH